MNSLNKQQGIGIIKIIALTPVMLIGLIILLVIFSLLYKAYWDFRVEQICEKDGGRTIYEVIKLPEEELNKMRGNGQSIGLPARNYVKKDDKFFANSKTTIVHNGLFGLIIKKRVSRVIRLRDEKVLATQITFSRIRGDFYPLPAVHHSSFSCRAHKVGFYDEVLINNRGQTTIYVVNKSRTNSKYLKRLASAPGVVKQTVLLKKNHKNCNDLKTGI